jgi:hypothetical protein
MNNTPFTGDWIFAGANSTNSVSPVILQSRNYLSFLLERQPHLAELAETFMRSSGIAPLPKFYKGWTSALKNLYDYQVSPSELQSAVREMRSKGLYISSPYSVINICLALRSKNHDELYY